MRGEWYLKILYSSHCLFPQRNKTLHNGKLVKVKILNWLERAQNFKIFENECDIRNQRIEKQHDQSMEKKCDIKCKTGHPNVCTNHFLVYPAH